MVDESGLNPNYNRVVEDPVGYVNSFMEIDSLHNIANHESNIKLQNYFAEGKDLVLANLSKDDDRAIFLKLRRLMSKLINCYKKYKNDKRTVLPAIQSVALRIQDFVISTRASGDSRERELHVQQHAIKNWLNKQSKPNPADMVFGNTKNNN